MITEWLDTFKTRWATKNIDQVLDLFTDNVEYWETPYKPIENKDANVRIHEFYGYPRNS